MSTDGLTGETRTRKNTPRIREIEDEINKLVSELVKLVQPTDEEQVLCIEQVKDIGEPDVLGDLYLITDALDSRESIEEEYQDRLKEETDENNS